MIERKHRKRGISLISSYESKIRESSKSRTYPVQHGKRSSGFPKAKPPLHRNYIPDYNEEVQGVPDNNPEHIDRFVTGVGQKSTKVTKSENVYPNCHIPNLDDIIFNKKKQHQNKRRKILNRTNKIDNTDKPKQISNFKDHDNDNGNKSSKSHKTMKSKRYKRIKKKHTNKINENHDSDLGDSSDYKSNKKKKNQTKKIIKIMTLIQVIHLILILIRKTRRIKRQREGKRKISQ